MTTTEECKRTPLYDVQIRAGGRFIGFAGWDMPVQFSGGLAEHQAVRQHAGLFDVSHMGEVRIQGPQALEGLQYLVTNDVSKLTDGKALYTVMCVANGTIVDDLIIYREAADRYFLCINAGRRAADVAHMREVLARFDCTMTDCSDDYAQLALQGPAARGILSPLTTAPVAELAPFTWLDATVAGIANVRVACTGYTGEHGYELYCAPSDAPRLWQALLDAGAPHGLVPCGLAARDTLRLEMKYPLYGNDIDLEHNPLEAGLGWVVKWTKGDFLGRAALEAVKAAGPARKWVGLKMIERGIARHGCVVQHQGQDVGVVTSGTHSPSLGEPIATAYVPAALSAIGTQLHVVIRNKPVAAEVVKTPFYAPAK